MKPVSRLAKRRVAAAAALMLLAVLVMGAARMTQEAAELPRRCFTRVMDWRDWSETVLTTVPGGESPEWRAAAAQCPLMMVQASCRTIPAGSE